MAMASRIQDDQVLIIDDLSFEQPATRQMADVLKALSCDGVSVLVTTAGQDANVYKSARNIEKVSVSPVAELNALDILGPSRLVVTKAAMDKFKERANAK